MGESHVGQCRLCPHYGTLVQSHIYPKALALELGSEGDAPRVRTGDPSIHERLIRTGWSAYFICDTCEQKSKVFDDYAVKFLRRSPDEAVERISQDGYRSREWSGVDAGKLKLFVLWCLWRGANCGLDEFRSLHLGPHAAAISDMLERRDPRGLHDYTVVIEARDCDPTMTWISWMRSRAGPVNLWKCFIHGHVFHVKVDKGKAPPRYAEVALQVGRNVVTPVSRFLGTALFDAIENMLVEHKERERRRLNRQGAEE